MRGSPGERAVHSKEAGDGAAYRPMAFSLGGPSAPLVLFPLLAAAAIFFVLPRVSAGYLTAYAPGGELTTGFSDRVQLGRIGEIQQSSSVVMHVQIDGDKNGGFRLNSRLRLLNTFASED